MVLNSYFKYFCKLCSLHIFLKSNKIIITITVILLLLINIIIISITIIIIIADIFLIQLHSVEYK